MQVCNTKVNDNSHNHILLDSNPIVSHTLKITLSFRQQLFTVNNHLTM